jgi:GPN-loop GTPase
MDARNFFNKKFFRLNEKIVDVVDNFWSVNFQPLNIQDEESVQDLMINIDNMVQYDEYRMPKDKDFLDNQEVTDEMQM